MPDLSHLWQRFLLASSLLVGLAIGAAATVFGYSNLATVNIRWSVFHIDGVPLWTVAVVPLALVIVAGTLYHWMDGLHHFTEHMRHRRRVHELEAEVASLRAHMDQVLEMPDQSTSRLPRKPITAEPVVVEALAPVAEASAPALPERSSVPTPDHGDRKTSNHRAARSKRATLTVAAEPAKPAAVKTNGGQETAPIASQPED
ncbi:MAG TPA: hypothetical protein VIJ58_04085 [Candidatus Dormibacteraeota bacterium]